MTFLALFPMASQKCYWDCICFLDQADHILRVCETHLKDVFVSWKKFHDTVGNQFLLKWVVFRCLKQFSVWLQFLRRPMLHSQRNTLFPVKLRRERARSKLAPVLCPAVAAHLDSSHLIGEIIFHSLCCGDFFWWKVLFSGSLIFHVPNTKN